MSNGGDISKMIGEAEKEFDTPSVQAGSKGGADQSGYKQNIDSETLVAKSKKAEIDEFANNDEADALLAMVAQSGGMPDTERTRGVLGKSASAAAEFRSFEKGAVVPQASSLDFVHEIPVQLTVELGRTKIPIKNILQLAQGSVVELDGLAGDPMEVLVNGYLIALGEVVVVNDRFGIRLTEVLSPTERLKKLGPTR